METASPPAERTKEDHTCQGATLDRGGVGPPRLGEGWPGDGLVVLLGGALEADLDLLLI